MFFSGYTHDELTDMVGKATGEDFIVESVGEPYQVKARIIEQESRSADFPEQTYDDRVNDTYNHTEGIRDKVLNAREQCRDFDDFKELLAKEDIGVTESKSGELMFYEARRDENGEILPRGENEEGLLDWAVGAKTLANKWQCEATHDWFEKNTPKEPTAPEHDSAREVIPPQKDLNLICNAVHSDLEERGIKTSGPETQAGCHQDSRIPLPRSHPRRPRHRVLRPKSRSWNGGERQGLTGTADD